MNNPKYIDVILPIKHGIFTYDYPAGCDKLEVGYTIIVPLGKNLYSGIVVAMHSKKPKFKTRSVAFIPKRNPTISQEQLKFWNWIAAYYFCSIGEVSDAALPSILKLKSEAQISLSENYEALATDDYHNITVEFLKDNGTATINQLLPLLGDNALNKVNQMLDSGFIEFKTEEEKYKPLIEKRYSINIELIEIAQSSLKRSPKQRLVLDFLTAHSDKNFTTSEIIENIGVSQSVVRSFISQPFVIETVKELSRFDELYGFTVHNITLSDKQLTAYSSIKSSFKENKPVLLHGVTGSGKTEIYIKLIEETIAQNKQVLYLLPEIVISSQIIKRLQRYFGNKVCIYHSRVNQSVRAEIWYDILNNNNFNIIVGPRSALFLPFSNLGLVIVDEEHDTGYKQQDPAPRYNARDAAVVLAQMSKSALLLGSATPSLESIHNVNSNKYIIVELLERYGNTPLPKVELVDYRKWYRRHEVKGHLTPLLKGAMDEAFEKGEQVILLQNRRGFAPFVQCPSCGHIPQCKNCDISLTAHKYQNRLVCHYCGYSIKTPDKCPECNNTEFKFQGFGTEKIEIELKKLFPDKTVARLDSDTSSSKKSLEEIMTNFAERKTDILIGTQMVSKGLDFGGVNLVGVLNADNMLSFPDFRSYERGLQTLLQFAGRAGRRGEQGRVIIQSSQLEHPVIAAISSNNYSDFTQLLLKERQLFNYPPFSRIIMLTIRHSNRNKTDKAANLLMQLLQRAGVTNILGPYVPPIPKIKRQHYSNIMIKLNKNDKLMSYRNKVLSSIDTVINTEGYKSVNIIADVDPY